MPFTLTKRDNISKYMYKLARKDHDSHSSALFGIVNVVVKKIQKTDFFV